MDHLSRTRGVVRATTTRLITCATEALQAVNHSPADLQLILDDLQDKDVTLLDFNERIADLINGDAKNNDQLTAALHYHDKMCNMMSRVRYLLNSASRPADSTGPVITTATEPQGVYTQERGRVQQFDDNEVYRHLVSLPADHWYTRFLVDAVHEHLLYGAIKLNMLVEVEPSGKGRPVTFSNVISIDSRTLFHLLLNSHPT
ncbi:hypothetical protein MRX96_009865 [Rhipicephalus microplus]